MRIALSTLLVLVLVTPAATRAAESNPFTTSTVEIEAGAFLGDFDTSARLSGPNGGDFVDLEDDLGLDTDLTAFRGELRLRLGRRHRLGVGYYQFDRQASAMTTRTFVVETEGELLEFDAGVDVDTEFDWRLVPLTYAFSFIQNQHAEVAVAAGVHWLDATIAYEGVATINGVSTGNAAEREKTSAPLPVVGLEAEFAITPRWRVGARGQYFGLDYDEFSGDLTDFRIATEYRFADFLGIGVGYTWYDVDIDHEDGEFNVEVDYDYSGPEAFVTLSF